MDVHDTRLLSYYMITYYAMADEEAKLKPT